MRTFIFLVSWLFYITAEALNAQAYMSSVEKALYAYTENMKAYAYAQGSQAEIQSRQTDLNDMFRDGPLASHFNDLENTQSACEVGNYLLIIKNKYKHKLLFEFSELNVEDCSMERNSRRYVKAFAKKEIKFENNDKKNFLITIIYDVTNTNAPMIDMVTAVELLTPEDNCKGLNTGNSRIVRDIADERYEEYMREGDAYFSAKNYNAALAAYEQARYFRDTEAVKTKIKSCREQLNAQYYITQGDDAFRRNDYDKAVEYYEKAMELQPGNATLGSKVRDSKTKLTEKRNRESYAYYKEQADSYLQKKFFDRAKSLYQQALLYKPGDTYCNDKITQCEKELRLKNDRYVYEQLDIARNYFRSGKNKNYDDAVKIMTEMMPSGKLTGSDYYMMAQALDQPRSNLRSLMGYDNQYCYMLASIYLHKAAFTFNHAGARDMWENHFSHKSRKMAEKDRK